MDTASLQRLSNKLREIQEDLRSSEDTTKHCIKRLKEHTAQSTYQGTSDPDTLSDVTHLYRTYLTDYEKHREATNDDYQDTIRGLSEAYLSLCPFYKGRSLPEPSFLGSTQDIGELYGLFMLMGVATLYGLPT